MNGSVAHVKFLPSSLKEKVADFVNNTKTRLAEDKREQTQKITTSAQKLNYLLPASKGQYHKQQIEIDELTKEITALTPVSPHCRALASCH